MTAPPDDLVARFDVNTYDDEVFDMVRSPTGEWVLYEEYATVAAKNKSLVAELRDRVIHFASPTKMRCGVCDYKWPVGSRESHASGCLAAGAANER